VAQREALGIARMFSLFKRQQKPLTADEYESEFRRYLHEFGGKLTVGDSPQERVFFAVSYINTELGRDGAENWIEIHDKGNLDTLREHLAAESSFTSEQLKKIRQSLDEIEACGREIEQRGESSQNVTEAIDYLVMRVIDWLRLHPKSE
jgi:hypothetical protein